MLTKRHQVLDIARGLNYLHTFQPNVIHGDLDSLKDHVRAKFEEMGVEISLDPDQYSTDFGKCVKKIVEDLPDVREVLVLGSIGETFDVNGLSHFPMDIESSVERCHRNIAPGGW